MTRVFGGRCILFDVSDANVEVFIMDSGAGSWIGN